MARCRGLRSDPHCAGTFGPRTAEAAVPTLSITTKFAVR